MRTNNDNRKRKKRSRAWACPEKLHFFQGNLFRGIDKKTVRREGISICLLMISSQQHSYIRKQNGCKLQSIFFFFPKNKL